MFLNSICGHRIRHNKAILYLSPKKIFKKSTKHQLLNNKIVILRTYE